MGYYGKCLFCLFSSYTEGARNTSAAHCYTATHTVMMLKETPKYLDGIKILSSSKQK